jgi:hypothetical protein
MKTFRSKDDGRHQVLGHFESLRQGQHTAGDFNQNSNCIEKANIKIFHSSI